MGCGRSREEGQEANFERSEPLLDFNCKVGALYTATVGLLSDY